MEAILQKILEIILSGRAGFILSLVYFRKNSGGIKEALSLFAVWFIVGGILDLLITIQYVKAANSYLWGLKTFYGSWSLWLGFVFMLAGVVLASYLKHSLPMKMSMPSAPSYPSNTPSQPMPTQPPAPAMPATPPQNQNPSTPPPQS
jgi:hypothetical protein